jgi:hypothetical protein
MYGIFILLLKDDEEVGIIFSRIGLTTTRYFNFKKSLPIMFDVVYFQQLKSLLCKDKNKSPVPKLVYQVYVIELSKKVFTENVKFRTANPQFNGVLECLYVGMTSKTPAERFRQHKTGYTNKKGYKISANIVEKYGIYLRPSLYNHINLKQMTREEALKMEAKLAWDLRRKGYAVWFN